MKLGVQITRRGPCHGSRDTMTPPVEPSVATPKLRAVDSFLSHSSDGEPCLVLRDPTGVAKTPALVPVALVPVIARFSGDRTHADIRRELLRDEGLDVPLSAIRDAAEALHDALFLEGPKLEGAIAGAQRAFLASPLRRATFAGSAYPSEPAKLEAYIAKDCVDARFAAEDPLGAGVSLRALVLPHIDPWRGARGYGACSDALEKALPEGIRTFVLLGTSHAPMAAPFCICPKGFDTPFGPLESHDEAIGRLVKASRFDPHADLLNHEHEHSIEFSAVFLKHALDRAGRSEGVRIVPILCGLGHAQRTGSDPAADPEVAAFLDELRNVVRDENAVVLAGADLAHIGPRFGDPRAADAKARSILEARDRESLGLARQGDARGFFDHVVSDGDTRRVCGTGPVYTLLSTLNGAATGKILYYDQNVDPKEGSIVSHAGLAFLER